MKPRVFVIDDEPRMAQVIATALGHGGFDCHTFTEPSEALAAAAEAAPDVVVSDVRMPGMDGMELLDQLRTSCPDVPVVLVTAHGSVPAAVSAIRKGAFDYVTKPFDNDELRAAVGRAFELRRLSRENRVLRKEVEARYAPDEVVAESAAMRSVLDLVRRVARSRATVLIQGESGTGKELVARLVHFWSDRVGEPFIAVNASAFAGGLLESELFGHERGAFTGAVRDRAGCFERADRGTLFLDEIGEIDDGFQAKLLRVLQDGEVLRVGGTRPRRIDVRVVAATNRNLVDEVAAGRFREDLFFRLNVIPVQLPPLRDRPVDILPLAERFLRGHAEELKRPLHFSDATRDTLHAHDWPGNVRELANAIERAALLARADEVQPEDLLLRQEQPPAPSGSGMIPLQQALDEAAARHIRNALTSVGGQRIDAARALGIDRTTLYRTMRRLGIEDSD